MTDITSREDEKGRELAKDAGRQEEQNNQRDRDLAKEKGRKQGQEEERAKIKQKTGWGSGTKIVISLVVLIIIVAVAGILTLTVSVTNVSPGNALPYTTNYGVSFPEGQTLAIGNTQISVLSNQNELFSNIDGDQQKLVVGEDRNISERRAVITTLGAITLVDTYFQIDLKYDGDRDNRAYFDMAVHTSRQVPDYLLNRLLPTEIDARPI
ncbi:hypothetical protein [Methanoregula sp.]|jgi:hypothetical protein|uniref:hypothetical protein n=1 Tax=Methanoregula sp. TaxID=2052170 RepID=UPI003C2A3097